MVDKDNVATYFWKCDSYIWKYNLLLCWAEVAILVETILETIKFKVLIWRHLVKYIGLMHLQFSQLVWGIQKCVNITWFPDYNSIFKRTWQKIKDQVYGTVLIMTEKNPPLVCVYLHYVSCAFPRYNKTKQRIGSNINIIEPGRRRRSGRIWNGKRYLKPFSWWICKLKRTVKIRSDISLLIYFVFGVNFKPCCSFHTSFVIELYLFSIMLSSSAYNCFLLHLKRFLGYNLLSSLTSVNDIQYIVDWQIINFVIILQNTNTMKIIKVYSPNRLTSL